MASVLKEFTDQQLRKHTKLPYDFKGIIRVVPTKWDGDTERALPLAWEGGTNGNAAG